MLSATERWRPRRLARSVSPPNRQTLNFAGNSNAGAKPPIRRRGRRRASRRDASVRPRARRSQLVRPSVLKRSNRGTSVVTMPHD